jgi:FMN-dependent NADH-azoreductase
VKVVAILGTYRREGATSQAVEAILAGARARGATTSTIYLLDHPIEFCRNCRACTQPEGSARGSCQQHDALTKILDELDAADSIVLASPVNFFNVTALTRRFLERLVVYAYWPWGAMAPKERITKKTKRAVVVLSSAAPMILTRLFTGAPKALKTAASLLGAGTIDTFYLGLAAKSPDLRLSEQTLAKAHRLGAQLV